MNKLVQPVKTMQQSYSSILTGITLYTLRAKTIFSLIFKEFSLKYIWVILALQNSITLTLYSLNLFFVRNSETTPTYNYSSE